MPLGVKGKNARGHSFTNYLQAFIKKYQQSAPTQRKRVGNNMNHKYTYDNSLANFSNTCKILQ